MFLFKKLLLCQHLPTIWSKATRHLAPPMCFLIVTVCRKRNGWCMNIWESSGHVGAGSYDHLS